MDQEEAEIRKGKIEALKVKIGKYLDKNPVGTVADVIGWLTYKQSDAYRQSKEPSKEDRKEQGKERVDYHEAAIEKLAEYAEDHFEEPEEPENISAAIDERISVAVSEGRRGQNVNEISELIFEYSEGL